MKKQKKQMFFTKLQEQLDIPKEVVRNVPVITMVADEDVHIENFINIVSYEENCIRLKTQCGILCIKGKMLMAKEMDSEEIHIQGKICSVAFE
ncbi:MAG: YabP/YqfC family sporulation protein [Cellulosilyticaceae bacterium]